MAVKVDLKDNMFLKRKWKSRQHKCIEVYALSMLNKIGLWCVYCARSKEGKGSSYSVMSMGSKLIPVSRQSPHRWHNHKPGGSLPLVSTYPTTERHRPLTCTKLYCLVNRGTCVGATCPRSHLTAPRLRFDPGTFQSPVQPVTVTPHHQDTLIVQSKMLIINYTW